MYGKETRIITWKTTNLTYDDIINKVYSNFTLEAVNDSPYDYSRSLKTFQSFVYPTGVCQHFGFKTELELWFLLGVLPQDNRNMDFRVFITDPSKASFFSLDFFSHKGPKIGFENAHLYFDIAIVVKDLNNPADQDKCDPYQHSSFSSCVDNYIQSQILKVRIDFVNIII